MAENKNALHVFLFSTVALLPVTFFLWYVTAPYHLVMIAAPTGAIGQWLMPEAVRHVMLDGHLLTVVTQFVPGPGGQLVPDPGALLTASFKVNPLIVGFGLPLFAAMTLAAPGKGKLARLVVGLILLVPVHIACVIVDVLAHLVQVGGPAVLQMLDMGAAGYNALQLARRFTVLILPGVAPLIVWVALHRQFLARLAPQFASRKLARQGE